MKRNGIERSMSNKGNCYDNSVIECFFGNLKTEIGDLDQYKTVQALIDRIEQYIKYYNERRIQLGLDGMYVFRWIPVQCSGDTRSLFGC